MDKFDRIFQLHTILQARRTAISLEDLMDRLECSRSTVLRTLSSLKDNLGAPIVFDPNTGGYKYDASGSPLTYELPGIWFSPVELQALAIVRRLLADAGGGLLEEHLGALSKRLDELTRHQRLNLGEAASRLRFPSIASRPAGRYFEQAMTATFQRRKLWIEYHARSTDRRTDRTVSPQRLTHYRETWYLDAWDEERNALRSFSADRIQKATVLGEAAFDAPDNELDQHYATAYGIFGGQANNLAVLLFSAEIAQWVADERWHPHQQSSWLTDGRYELRIPYREPRELVMDIMRHGMQVEVLAPPELRRQVADELARAAARYGEGRS